MKRFPLLFPLAAAMVFLSLWVKASEDSQPNVVLILSDDQGWRDYGFMGSHDVETPNLDGLAARSLVFERGYVPAPLCRPSLASIVSGLYPQDHGVVANDVDPGNRAASDVSVRESFHRHPSWIRLLVENGYEAFQSGKWWEGSWQEGGFTDGMTHGDPKRRGRHGDAGLEIGRGGMKPVLDFIDGAGARKKPFLVWYAPFLPHTPHNPPADLLEKYRQPDRPENVAKYYAMCEWFDRTCGELLDHLDRRGLRDNTLVLYVCDNGWVARQKDGNPEGWWPDYAPRSKGSPFEMGIRSPILISWPGHIAPARSSDLASSLDLMPTALGACGIEAPKGLAGIDLRDEKARRGRKAIFGTVHSIHNMIPNDPGATLQYQWCIEGRWKLLLRHHGLDTTQYKTVHEWDQVDVRLYDLEADPEEKHNLAGAPDQAERIARLRQRIAGELGAPGDASQASAPTRKERRISVEEYRDKMAAGWIGQMAGVGWGAPTEFRFNGRIIPEDQAPEWKPETINQFNQDDIYVEMTFLRSLDRHGFDVPIRQAGIDFANSGYRLWHANKAGRDNLRQGIAPPDSGHPQFNSHADDIDYQIEADYAGLIAPGLPNLGIELGEKFGRLMNYGDGLYGGQFVAGMYAEAFFENDPRKIVEAGLACIPAGSQYAETIRDVLRWHAEAPKNWPAVWERIEDKYQRNAEYRRFSCSKGKSLNIDAKINGAYIAMGLLYGEGDLDDTIMISMRCGQDSDCNPSNAAGILFTTVGRNRLPARFVSKLDTKTRFSHTAYDFDGLVGVCEKLARQAVNRSGGRIEQDGSGAEIFVIPVIAPQPSVLEQCWEAGPVANSRFSESERKAIQPPPDPDSREKN